MNGLIRVLIVLQLQLWFCLLALLFFSNYYLYILFFAPARGHHPKLLHFFYCFHLSNVCFSHVTLLHDLLCFEKGFEKVELFCFVVNNVDDVAFKLLIDNIEFVDKLFKRLNMVVDVAFKLLIDNIELVDKLFKFVIVDI